MGKELARHWCSVSAPSRAYNGVYTCLIHSFLPLSPPRLTLGHTFCLLFSYNTVDTLLMAQTSTFWRTMLQQPHGLKKKAEANEALLRRITKERDEAGFFRAMVAGNSRMLSSQGAVLTCEHRDMNNRKCEQKFPSLQGKPVSSDIGCRTAFTVLPSTPSLLPSLFRFPPSLLLLPL